MHARTTLTRPVNLVDFPAPDRGPGAFHVVDATMFWSPRGGGVKSYLRAKNGFLQREESIRHTVVVPGAIAAASPQVPGLPLPFSSGYRFPLARNASARVLRALKPDVIEVGDPYQMAWSALDAGQASGVPVCAFFHSNILEMAQRLAGKHARQAAAIYVRKLYPHFDRVFAPSAHLVSQLHDLGVSRAVLQPLGVDTTVFHPQPADGSWRARHNIPPDAVVLLYVGRFAPEKNLPLLADAVERLGAPYLLVAIGDGPVTPRGSRVRVLPYEAGREALARAYADADAFVHAGDQETFGLAVLEALACGLPVVGAKRAGVGDLVVDAVGITVPPGSAEAFARAIVSLRQRNPDALAKAARAHALSYDWRNVFPPLIQHYRQLAHGPERIFDIAPDRFDAAGAQPVHRHS
ncbi:glycosyltransferase family 1 protein [Pigmentiphaga aceris]|uniref:Glycosyltransferase family 1 protein n=1 Tax=Pigmentiphaga aceris TaxID=1940612 RepID=A0A5C0AUI2_9BURK|nr:glycosyltransferase [Pigmentiphaga aceris]QEI05334.1 glycosyltransferase family 1 protein [Pigmentiphaga aceris]